MAAQPLSKGQIKAYRGYLADERNGEWLYTVLADAEKDPKLAEIYRRFAQAEHRHAAAWAQHLSDAGVPVAPFRPGWRSRALAVLARRFGVALVLPSVKGMEQATTSAYSRESDATDMAPDEASHARLLGQITQGLAGGLGGSAIAQLEGRHRSGGGNALRAAVLGANDGLVSNLSLIMGVAGADLPGGTVLITGLAGLLAGACSMALGEWLSVQSSRELYERQIEIEKAEIASTPQEEAEELALIYQSRGLSADHANAMARQILSDREGALQTLTREELGIDPEELGGSAWVAAVTSFLLFAAGAILPVIPFMFLTGRPAVTLSAALSALGLFAIGTAITLFTGRGAWRSGLRMVVFGGAAAAITFGIGRLVGVGLGG